MCFLCNVQAFTSYIQKNNSKLMISLLRKLSISVAHTVPPVKLLKSANSFGGSQRLAAISQQFRLYKPFDLDAKEQSIEEHAEKIVSKVGLVESVAPIAEDQEILTPKRAAVLVCLLHGDSGDLRVILTKRSSGVSTHSGKLSFGYPFVWFLGK